MKKNPGSHILATDSSKRYCCTMVRREIVFKRKTNLLNDYEKIQVDNKSARFCYKGPGDRIGACNYMRSLGFIFRGQVTLIV